MLPNRSRPDENPTTVFRPRCPTPSFPDAFCHWPQRVLCSKRFRRVVGSQEDGTAMLQVVWHSFQAGAPVWTFWGGHFFLDFFGWTLCTCPTTPKNLQPANYAHAPLCTCPQQILGDFAVERISFPCPSAQPTTPKIRQPTRAPRPPVAIWIKSSPWRYLGHMCLGLSPGTCRSLPACLGGGRLACRTFEKTTCRGAGVADELWAIARRSCPWSLPRTTGTPTRTQHGTGIVDWMPSQGVCCSR